MVSSNERIEDLLFLSAERFKRKIGIISTIDDRKISFEMWLADAVRFAEWLVLRSEDTSGCMVLHAKNSYFYACALFGGFIARKAIVPIGPKATAQEVSFILSDCRPHVVLVDEDLFDSDRYKPIYVETFHEVVSLQEAMDEVKSINNVGQPANANVSLSPDDTALIMYTSGSSGEPRGVVCPHRQVMFAIKAINTILGNSPDDVLLCGLPFSFDYGLYQLFLAVDSGATAVVSTDFTVPMAIPHWIQKYGITGLPGVPSLFSMLLETDLLNRNSFNPLRYLSSTGDVLSEEVISSLRDQLPDCAVFPMYGLTECKRVSILSQEDFAGHEKSVGKALPGTSAIVVDEQGEPLKANMVGELVVRGPHVMQGYLNNPEASLRRFKRSFTTREISLFTGDYFRVDSEGFLYFEGRRESFLKVRGQRLSAINLENVLSRIPGIKQVVIVGVHDRKEGEALFAFIRPDRNARITAFDVSMAAGQQFPVTLATNRILLTDDFFPVNENGKIDRIYMKKIASDIDTLSER